MKKLVIFISGFILGAVVLSVIGYIVSEDKISSNTLSGLTLFEEKGECISKKEIKISHVLKPNMALGETGHFPNQIIVLIMNNENQTYYDNQIIKIPAGQCAIQVGIYQYQTKIGTDKTVPVVIIE